MAKFTLAQYFQGRIPDIDTLVPGYNVEMALNAAMALYWDKFFANTGLLADPDDLDETVLTERRKVLVALRAAVQAIPVVTKAFTKPIVSEATGGPATAKFEPRANLLKQLMPLWKDELEKLEQAEDISFETMANVPAYLRLIESDQVFSDSGYVFSKGTYYVKGD
jgi:hypothetical protein